MIPLVTVEDLTVAMVWRVADAAVKTRDASLAYDCMVFMRAAEYTRRMRFAQKRIIAAINCWNVLRKEW